MSDTMKRLLIWIAVVVALAIVHSLFGEDAVYEAPRRPLPPVDSHAWSNERPSLPPTGETFAKPNFEFTVEEDKERGDAIGTAFLVAPHTWMTAAHVLETCAKSYVRIRDQWRPILSWTLHPVADVAVAVERAAEGPPEIHLTDRVPVINQDGFHFGYPSGNPAAVRTKFVGMTRIRQGKPGKPVEQGWVWAEQDRSPPSSGSLGGISGGPQVDRTGAVQGITILQAERTGRLVTAPVSRAREILSKDVSLVGSGGTTIGIDDFGEHGAHVREAAGTVSLVFCSVSGHSRPR